MVSLYCTADRIGTPTGGGAVTYNEAAALSIVDLATEVLDYSRIAPSLLQMPESPFLYDVIADSIVLNEYLGLVRLAHFYAGTFSRTVTRLRNAGVRVSYTAAAHDPEVSREEFEAMGLQYTFPHITDPRLWTSYVEGYLAANLVICPSNHSANLMKLFGCTNVMIIPHGVTLPPAIPPVRNWNVGYLGQAGPDKGLRYLFKAWKKLNWADSRLVLAGSNTELAVNIFRNEGGGNIEFKGWIKSISSLFSDCAAYVQPSVTEGYGIEVLEAMAHGRPVIVSDGAGAADAITDGIDGFIVPKRNPDAIASRLQQLRDDPALYASMSQAALAKVKEYSWQNIHKLYAAAWQLLLA